MRRLLYPLVLATSASLTLSAGRLPAQEPLAEVQLSASAGLTWGGRLWNVAAQPVLVATVGPVSLLDTFALTRRLAPGLTAWLGFTKFSRPHIGFGAEVAWVAASLASGCGSVGQFQPDPNQTNTAICGAVGQQHIVTSAIAAQATITLRAAPRRDLSPYAKVGLGFAVLSGSFVGTGADYSTDMCPMCYKEIFTPDSRSFTWAGTAAAGLVFGGGLPVRFRVEVRDFVLGLPTVTGPANPASSHPVPPAHIRAAHRIVLAMGFDLVSGGPRRRRY